LVAGCAGSSPSNGVVEGLSPPPVYEPYATCASPEQGRVPGRGELLHVDFPPQALETVPPVYPQAALDAGIEGVVVLDVLVCSRGGVADARVRNSIPALDDYAIDAVRRWYWRAASVQGQPVAAWVEVPVVFELPR
jgi:protein TonB